MVLQVDLSFWNIDGRMAIGGFGAGPPFKSGVSFWMEVVGAHRADCLVHVGISTILPLDVSAGSNIWRFEWHILDEDPL